jgi:hypothetical protein
MAGAQAPAAGQSSQRIVLPPITAPVPSLEVVDVEPAAVENTHIVALLTVRFGGLDLQRCRLLRLPTGDGYDVLPPQMAYYNPQTDRRVYQELAAWPRGWNAHLVPLAVRAYEAQQGQQMEDAHR